MTKRLRGWKKDVELGLAERPGAEAEDPNPFATKLLSHWAHGTLSAKAIQELAHLAQLGGTSHAEVAALAKSGNYGENPGDIHKAIMQTFLPNVSIPAGFDVEVPCLDPRTSQASTSTASIFLPHTMFSALYEHYPTKWAELFCPPKLEEFWKGVGSKKDDRLKGHPLKKRENWRTQAIPIFVHGDGAEFMTRDSLMIYSFGCVLNLFGSLDSHLLMGVFPKVATTKDAWPGNGSAGVSMPCKKASTPPGIQMENPWKKGRLSIHTKERLWHLLSQQPSGPSLVIRNSSPCSWACLTGHQRIHATNATAPARVETFHILGWIQMCSPM